MLFLQLQKEFKLQTLNILPISFVPKFSSNAKLTPSNFHDFTLNLPHEPPQTTTNWVPTPPVTRLVPTNQ